LATLVSQFCFFRGFEMGKILIILVIVMLLLTGCDDLAGQLAESGLMSPVTPLATLTPLAGAGVETSGQAQSTGLATAAGDAIVEAPVAESPEAAAEASTTPAPEATPAPQEAAPAVAADEEPATADSAAAAEVAATAEPPAAEQTAAPQPAQAESPEPTLAAPELPAQATLQASPLLGISYLLPQGWERAAWGEAGCATTNCRGERLSKTGDEEPLAALSLVLMEAQEAEAFLAELQGYQESMVAGQPAFWRADDTGLEGLLLLADETLQVRGRWGEDPKSEMEARQILGSILPFKQYEIPGLVYLELPAHWLLLPGTRPGIILFDNGQAEPHAGMADCSPKATGALTLLLADEGDAAQPPLELLQDRLAELAEEITVLEEAQSVEINGQPAATVLYQPADPEEETFRQLTMIQGPDRTLSVLGSGREERLAAARPLLDGILASLQVSAKREPPNLVNVEEIPEQYLPYRTTEYRLSYPPNWRPLGGGDVGIFVPGEATGEPYDLFADHLYVSGRLLFDPLISINADMTLEELLEKAWELESFVTGADIQMVSDRSIAAGEEQELAAVRVATSAYGFQPREGILAVARRGDKVYHVAAWLADYEAQRTAVENMVSSLEILE
jgi:hypothetical protein